MSTPNTPDEPSFDIIAFEDAAKTRAGEFISEVARLASLEIEDEAAEWLEVSGGQYTISDGIQIAARHERWDDNPRKVVAKLKIVQPFVESLGADRNLRRVQIARLILCRTFFDEPDEEQLASLQSELQLDPQWHPGELIWARTTAQVECKLPNSPNFRTERNSSSLPANVRMAHIAARRHAGEPVEDPLYGIAEHRAVIALLSSIDLRLMEPRPLEPDFEEIWLDPEPNLRSWRPKEW